MPGSVLWNKQLQKPEWVSDSELDAKLASDTYTTYAGSGSSRASTGGYIPAADLTTVRTGAGVVTSDLPASIAGAENRAQAAIASHDTFEDEVLTAIDGVVSTASVGLLTGTGIGGKKQEALRAEANPYAHAGGALLAALASMKVPVGLASPLARGAARLGTEVESAVLGAGEATARRQLLSKAAGLGVTGALEGEAYAAGAQINNALNDKPVSGAAIIDGMTLGGIIGGGLGALGASASRYVGKVDEAKAQMEMVAGLAGEEGAAIYRAASEPAGMFVRAHEHAADKLKVLEELVDRGAMGVVEDSEIWLAERRAAMQEAKKAQKAALRAVGAKSVDELASRYEHILKNGTAKEVEKAIKAIDVDYANAVNKVDEAMRPGSKEWRRLLDLDVEHSPGNGKYAQNTDELGNLEIDGSKLTRGKSTPQEVTPEVAASREAKTAAGKTPKINPDEVNTNPGGPAGGPALGEDIREIPGRRAEFHSNTAKRFEAALIDEEAFNASGRAPTRNVAVDDLLNQIKRKLGVEADAAETAALGGSAGTPRETGLRVSPLKASGGIKTSEFEALSDTGIHPARQAEAELTGQFQRQTPLVDPQAPTQVMDTPAFARGGAVPGGRPAYLDALDFWQGMNRANPVRPSPAFAEQIDQLLNQLDTKTGGRLGNPALREFASAAGIDLARIQGPAAERALALWSLRKLAQAAGESTVAQTGNSFWKSVAKRAVGNLAGFQGFAAAGPVGGAVGRELGYRVASAVFSGQGAIAKMGGAIRFKASKALASALSAKNIRTLAHTVPAVRTAYQPGEEPTRDFLKKASQLRLAMGNPEALRKTIEENLDNVRALDPGAANRAADMAMTRIRNLSVRLPAFLVPGLLGKPMPPNRADVADWELYEAVTEDPEIALRMAAAGRMTDTVVEAIRDQHPEFLQEVVTQMLSDREALAKAPLKVQMALSKLVGIPLVPEADPAYVQRIQQEYEEETQAAETKKAQQAAPNPTQMPVIALPGQVYASPRPPGT